MKKRHRIRVESKINDLYTEENIDWNKRCYWINGRDLRINATCQPQPPKLFKLLQKLFN